MNENIELTPEEAPTKIRLRCRLGWHDWSKWKLRKWHLTSKDGWMSLNVRKCLACDLTQAIAVDNDEL